MMREGDLVRECRVECCKPEPCLISERIAWGGSRFSFLCAYVFLFGRSRARDEAGEAMAQRFCSHTELGILRIGSAEGIRILILWLKKCLQPALPSPQHHQRELLHQILIMQGLLIKVLIVALIGILPMAPRQLQYKGYHLSLLGTTCTTGYVLFAFYGLPRAGNMQAVHGVTV